MGKSSLCLRFSGNNFRCFSFLIDASYAHLRDFAKRNRQQTSKLGVLKIKFRNLGSLANKEDFPFRPQRAHSTSKLKYNCGYNAKRVAL